MSALPPIADIDRLFDHLVGAEQKACRHLNAKRLGGSDVHNCLDLGYLFDRGCRGASRPEVQSKEAMFSRESSKTSSTLPFPIPRC